MRAGDSNRLNTERMMLSKRLSILDNDSLPLHIVLSEQMSSGTDCALRRSTERYRKSLILVAIKIF